MGRYLDFDKVDLLDNEVLVYGKRVYDIACGDKLPFENVAPVVHALWEAIPMRYEDDDPYQLFKCSNCDYETHTLTNYCPYCGASMEVK